MKQENELQHIGLGTGEMQAKFCLESYHRAHSFQAAKPSPCRVVPQNISWCLWFERDACKIIEMTAEGEVDHRGYNIHHTSLCIGGERGLATLKETKIRQPTQ